MDYYQNATKDNELSCALLYIRKNNDPKLKHVQLHV